MPRPSETPRPTVTSAPTRPLTRELSLPAEALEAELRRASASGPIPLLNPALQLHPPDRVLLTGEVQIAVFRVPVEIEGLVTVESGAVRVRATRVQAVGAQLPDAVSTALGRQVDAEAGAAIAAALPPGAQARRVTVETDRIVVEVQ